MAIVNGVGGLFTSSASRASASRTATCSSRRCSTGSRRVNASRSGLLACLLSMYVWYSRRASANRPRSSYTTPSRNAAFTSFGSRASVRSSRGLASSARAAARYASASAIALRALVALRATACSSRLSSAEDGAGVTVATGAQPKQHATTNATARKRTRVQLSAFIGILRSEIV